jgi:hypothetical protein
MSEHTDCHRLSVVQQFSGHLEAPLSLCLVNSKSGQSARRYTTYTLEYVLVDTFVAEWLQMLLEPRRLSCAGTSAKDHQLEIVLSGKDYRAYEMSTSIRSSCLIQKPTRICPARQDW